MKFFLSLFIIFLSFKTQGQTTIKTMFYNLLNYPTAPPSNRNALLKDILNTYEPDIFMVSELETETAANSILNYSLSEINKNYAKAPFVSNQSNTSTDSNLQQLVYYNNDFFVLDNYSQITTNIRDINHYTLILKTSDYLTNPIHLEVFVTHLKASQGTVNEQKRFEMVTAFTNALNTLPSDSYVIFAGDFNFYTSSENGYQKILDNTNNVIMKDVLNLNNNLQSWHNNYSYHTIHTQATRISNTTFNGYGAGGGLDDRFDFITLSENIVTNSNINYVSNSYKSYGNNGTCFNKRIDDVDCSGSFSQTLRNNLYNMSDHLPVVLSLETSQTLTTQDNLFTNQLKLMNGNLIKNELQFNSIINLNSINFKIHNSIGQEVFKSNLTKNKTVFDISKLPEGMYYIKFINFQTNLKFIKIK